ncbi:hypothetical protein TRFO_13041 [Tritrichomonas foetus]|uniref:BTB domain-containing protein n=1 Tax=Tritrichomonas foetus TaxID=1144522 RepID=A0A1J4L0G4_9EUKA|nr:hypothetical protein TRFO_13041 [Tritrichomonas foetus]|eukprot:OHT16624.1 hypothetical protein TRFO_13041 [Tritrichomonas foetus]
MSIPSSQVFTLTINGRNEELNCRAFTKLSRRAKEIVTKENQYSFIIDRAIPEDVAAAFIAACRVEQFKVTVDVATDLLYLSNEWMIDTLESFVVKFMKSKNMNTNIELPNSDYLGMLIEQSEDHSASEFLYDQVGKRLNKYFDDERLLDLNVEALFRVVVISDLDYDMDQEKYRNFVFKLLKYNVYSAVPLILQLNLHALTHPQNRNIYETPEIHDQNMTYFLTIAMSALRNKSEKERVRFVKAIQKGIESLQTDLRNQRHKDAHDLHDDHKKRLTHLKTVAAEQKRQLDEIKEYREEQMKRHDEECLNFTKSADELREMMTKQKRDLNARIKAMEQLKNEVKDEIDRNLHGLRNKIAKDLKDAAKEADKRHATINEALKEPFDGLQANVDEAKKLIDDLEAQVNDSVNDAKDKQTVLATKMMRDFMRLDGFVRRTGKRFQLFSDMDVWGVKPEEVKEVETYLGKLERSIDKLCPIRHNVSQ